MIALYPSITVTNATEGGVRIEGTIQKPLKEVCQELGQKAVCFEDFLEAEDNQITEKEAASSILGSFFGRPARISNGVCILWMVSL